MDEPWGHDATWNKPVIEGQILQDSTYSRYLKYQIHRIKGRIVVSRN